MSDFNTLSLANYRSAYAHEEMNPKRRSTMEDCHRIIKTLGNDPSFSYFGVYDGHGGRQIVDFLEEALENNINIELKLDDDAEIPERLTRAFLITDMQSRRMDITTSGATAVSALIKKEPNGSRSLYVANVGDSRAVLACRSSSGVSDELGLEYGHHTKYGVVARRLSYDHRAEDELEQKRINDAGGFCARGRVLGILAVTRAFGDHGMKDFVTANPFISTTVMEVVQDFPFLILACDGVWDVFSDQEAVDLVIDTLEEAKEKNKSCNGGSNENEEAVLRIAEASCASILVHASIERGSGDNITAIVVFLH